MKILVAGGSGFIGRRLIRQLAATSSSKLNQTGATMMQQEAMKKEIICLTRNPSSIKKLFDGLDVQVVEGDVSKYDDLVKVMSRGVDTAYYLVHSMEGASKEWKKFSERDRIAAKNFADAATACNVHRIIYLGGLTHAGDEELSEHMRSRKEVGEILQTSSASVTIFRAAVILGLGGGSFEMLKYLVERLPVMVCPKWVLTKSQPIAVDDVVMYLASAIESRETEGRTFDVGGPDVLTYVDMMKRYARMTGRSIKIIILPFLTPRLSSYWIDLVSPVSASLARPLIDSLKHEATIKNDSINKIIPIRTRSFEEAIQVAVNESEHSIDKTQKLDRTYSFRKKFLLLSLLSVTVLSATYYANDSSILSFPSTSWVVVHGLWFLGILAAVYFVRKDTRLGALVAGVIGWTAFGFFLANSIYPVLYGSITSQLSAPIGIVRDLIGLIISSLIVLLSHALFHVRR